MHPTMYHAPRKGTKIRASLPVEGNNLLQRLRSIGVLQGFARGYSERADLITQTLDGADLNAMWDEFQQTVSLANRYRSGLLQLLTYQVQRPVERVVLPSAEDFEEATEYGEPKGIRPPLTRVLGFDFREYDLAARYTFRYIASANADELRATNNSAIDASNRLRFRRVMQALFRNTTRDFVQSLELVDPITVYPFYNGDAEVPPVFKTYTHTAPHTHYLASGAGTIDSTDLDDMETHLYHHGYGVQQGTRLVLLANRQETALIKTFRVSGGDSYDFIPSAGIGGGVILPLGTIIGRPNETVPGQIGTYGPWIIVEEDMMPAGYIAGFATGGERNLSNPIGVREHENQALRGFRLVKGRDSDYPLIDSFYIDSLGTGVRHRGAGVVMQITAGAYAVPAAYA